MLFALGNGCPPNLTLRWILTSQTWSPEQTEKRARQIDFILNNEDGKRSQWFYFDLDHRTLLYLNGLRNSKPSTNNNSNNNNNNNLFAFPLEISLQVIYIYIYIYIYIFFFELFFCKKKYLLVGASSMLWTGQRVSESVSQ